MSNACKNSKISLSGINSDGASAKTIYILPDLDFPVRWFHIVQWKCCANDDNLWNMFIGR